MGCDPNGTKWYNKAWDWGNTIVCGLNPVKVIPALGSVVCAAIDGRWNEVLTIGIAVE